MKNKYYIYAPSNCVTGGQECLHQLCDSLNNKGEDAYIVYFPEQDAKIPDVYLKYNIKTAQKVEDTKGNTLVLYEALFDRAFHFKNVTIALWWLSVDNFFGCSTHYLSVVDYLKHKPELFVRSLKAKIYYLKDGYNFIKNNTTLEKLQKLEAINLCQSYYAENFLQYHRFRNVQNLFDYINSEFVVKENNAIREDIILYNPKKGFEFVKMLMVKLPQFKWKAIENMTYKEIANLMGKAKVYIDFGNHPGRDKIPREAVSAGLCVLTGNRGSAFFKGDIPINDEFRFDEQKFDLAIFEKVINNIFLDYEGEYKKFGDYIDTVAKAKETFNLQVDELIAYSEKDR